MSKVLSTKLAVDEVDRFSVAAEQKGLSWWQRTKSEPFAVLI